MRPSIPLPEATALCTIWDPLFVVSTPTILHHFSLHALRPLHLLRLGCQCCRCVQHPVLESGHHCFCLPGLTPSLVPACLHHGDICHPDFCPVAHVTEETEGSYVRVTLFFALSAFRGLLSTSGVGATLLLVSIPASAFSISLACSFLNKISMGLRMGLTSKKTSRFLS